MVHYVLKRNACFSRRTPDVRAEGMDTDVAEEYFDLLKEVTE
jgi:hypothetical protein